MKVSLWNIGGGFPLISRKADWSKDDYADENIDAFINVLREENSDILSLQEIHAESQNQSLQLDKIKSSLDLNTTPLYSYGKSHIKNGSYLSLATLSKFPIKNISQYPLPNPHLQIVRSNGDIWRTLDVGFLVAEVIYENQSIYVVNGHLAPFHYFERDFSEPEFNPIREVITNILLPLATKPTIIAADFNFDNLKQKLPKLFPTYTELFLEPTTPTRGQQDHILISSHWNRENISVKKSISDHFLCSVDITI